MGPQETSQRYETIAEEFARRTREAIGGRVGRIILFGSRARGEAEADSDYDVLVLVKGLTPALKRRAGEIGIQLSVERCVTIVPLVYDEREFTEERLFFLHEEILRDGIEL